MSNVGLVLGPRSSDLKKSWTNCSYCLNLEFKLQNEFIRHLREKHCTREGGSYVCRYGYNGVCSSLPVEGVNDVDYEVHVYKHHVNAMQTALESANSRNLSFRKMSQTSGSGEQITTTDTQWTVYSGSQNLPAVLNDPNAGKQRDFFTKMWGDSFVEKVDIPKLPQLPEINATHFEAYLKKIARRYRKHARMNASSTNSASHPDALQHFPHLRVPRSQDTREMLDLSEVPKIFSEPHLDLSDEKTFNAVFNISKEPTPATTSNSFVKGSRRSGKLLQEKLSHYLDVVEVQIAHQVAHKSEAFFQAMTSHDALMEQLTQTIAVVKTLREKICHIDTTLVRDSLDILRLERVRCSNLLVHQKLKLMATVHQTQPMIQLLLSTPDYVAALDLISTTQEILVQELAGVHSFRHLGSQLLEMERMIDKMLSAEFRRYATADLNRPLVENQQVLEGDKLVSIIFGMLRQKHFDFIDTYKEEAFTTIKAVVKQIVIEVVAASDSGDTELAFTGLGDQLQNLALHDWISLLENTTNTLLRLINRVKLVHDVMRQAADISAGKIPTASETSEDSNPAQLSLSVSDPADSFLSADEHAKVLLKLADLLTSICDYAHERVAQLVTTQSQGQTQNHTSNQHDQKQEPQSWSESSYWLVDKATAAQVRDLARVMDVFTESCERVCGRASTALRSAFKIQASKFVQRFHHDRKTKLGLILDSERWKQADVPTEFQSLVNFIVNTNHFAITKPETRILDRKPDNVLFVGDEKFAVVGTALLLLKMVVEYCVCASDLVVMAPNLCRNLAELLQLFNSRCCQLVLGAGALHVAGLKTITSTNLVLASRALQLVLWLLPHIREHFRGVMREASQPQTYRHGAGVNVLDAVQRDVNSHVREIQGKVVSIVNNLVAGQLSQWDAKPPVPSQAFRNISKHLTKLHEAVSNILPTSQVHDLYRTANRTFKDRLREQLVKMNVVNNGGPQHGVVTSELTFYLKTLKTLNALPPGEVNDDSMDDIWVAR